MGKKHPGEGRRRPKSQPFAFSPNEITAVKKFSGN